MKAPEKIKIVRFSDTAELSDYWVLENRTENDDIEYIHKDALLEWAKKLNEEYNKRYEESNHTCGEHWGQSVAFQRIIDKLNSI